MTASLAPRVIDALLLGQRDRRRQLQDFPILVDVWTEFAERPRTAHDLLVTPHREAATSDVAELIDERADRELDPRVSQLQGIVAAALRLEDLWKVLLPATSWWTKLEDALRGERLVGEATRGNIGRLLLAEVEREADRSLEATRPAQRRAEMPLDRISSDERQLARIGMLFGSLAAANAREDGRIGSIRELVDAFGVDEIAALGSRALEESEAARREMDDASRAEKRRGLIFNVSVNRRAEFAVTRSVPAIKADAARQLFSVGCSEINWAIIDSGIDGAHPAFRSDPTDPASPSRVKSTFDFSDIRAILSRSNRRNGKARANLASRLSIQGAGTVDEIDCRLQLIAEVASAGMPIDWTLVEPLIRRAKPRSPSHPHGTHVAGILGANWREEKDGPTKMTGVCPDIGIYDLRVLGPDAEQTEFAVIAALQFVRFLNSRNAFTTIDGVNLSLSIPHNVRNYACGRTPVCLEAESLVATGTIVIAAAGNRGYQRYRLADDTSFESYAASSITDPGNADGVITVGATHRYWPHTYGVSFFSSRGPTGDGRMKPDLLAPGERIESTIPDGGSDASDGTSMAAPHVSGAAALLMARHRELKGNPRKIKEVLCATATDLGRERSFQGHGMVDVLRAIQSL